MKPPVDNSPPMTDDDGPLLTEEEIERLIAIEYGDELTDDESGDTDSAHAKESGQG